MNPGVFVPVVDAVREILPLPAGFTDDDSATEPTNYRPKRRYVWPRRLSSHELEAAADIGPVVRLRVLYTVSAKGEPRVQKGDRALSRALDAITPAVHAAIESSRRASPLWWDLLIAGPIPDAVRTDVVRGYGFDLEVRLNDL